MHVKSLYLIGSGARENDFTNASDLDFIFSFKADSSGQLLPPFYDYFNLYLRWRPSQEKGGFGGRTKNQESIHIETGVEREGKNL